MEVILKKTKITNSIVKQTNSASETDLKTFEVLGWCNYKAGKYSHKYILLYKSATQELRVYLYFGVTNDRNYSDYKSRDGDYTPAKYNLEIKTSNYADKEHTFKSEEERAEFKETLKRVKHQAQIKGQIYI